MLNEAIDRANRADQRARRGDQACGSIVQQLQVAADESKAVTKELGAEKRV